ncbi:MAG TPA: peptide chain release factor N(5)-glutamine methyltransferase [Opitutaceae bacterium]|nr:peptide chain release factor N(5)-glutamine methyltransferase [Opitutaceae bacterium]
MITVLEVIKKSTEFFAARGIESARLNAELIVGQALGLKRMQLYVQFERMLTEAELEKIRPLVKRRSQREPIQYVLGETDWCGLHLKVDRRALIPRPETEYLVELVEGKLAERATKPARILDLGTGTGALALVFATRFPEAAVVAVDRSDEALALARENATALGLVDRVRLVNSNWFAALEGEGAFDLIVANPPYLTEQETQEASPEVRDHEPRSALAAGADGLTDLKTIIADAPRFMASGSLLALETGIRQHAALKSLCETAGLAEIESKQDLTGRDRYIFARKP